MRSTRWIFVSRSETGTRHRLRGQPGQDCHACLEVDDYLIIAMADGAGTRARSGEGAEIAVSHAMERAAGWAWSPSGRRVRGGLDAAGKLDLTLLVTGICMDAGAAIREEARRQGCAPESFATTLGLTIVAERWEMSGGVGDVACFSGSGDDWTLVNRPVKHGVAANPVVRSRTLLIPLYLGPPAVWFHARKPNDTVVVCTDGALGEFAEDLTPHRRSGLYVPKPAALHRFSLEGGAALKASVNGGSRRGAPSPERWLEEYIRKLMEQGEPDDLSIALALTG